MTGEQIRELEKEDLFLPDLHKTLFDGPSLLLGKIHYRLLHANRTVAGLSYEKAEGFHVPKSTKFGQEVGHDEIVWWIRKKEPNIPELLEKTKEILQKMDNFKHAVDAIEIGKDEEYATIIDDIKNITNVHSDTITRLHEYVEWLYSKDPLAPCILFNYKTWNSTPMSDRIVPIDISKQDPTEGEIQLCAQVACGIVDRFGYIANKGITTENYYEEVPYTTEFLWKYRLRISHEIRNFFHQHIEKLRIALQHVELEAKKPKEVLVTTRTVMKQHPRQTRIAISGWIVASLLSFIFPGNIIELFWYPIQLALVIISGGIFFSISTHVPHTFTTVTER